MKAAPDPEDVAHQRLLACDESGRIQGVLDRETCHRGDGRLHRAVQLLLRAPGGAWLVQRRRSPLWDDTLDFGGATHPLASTGDAEGAESDADAARRCLRTEWQLDLPLQPGFAFTYFARDGDYAEHEFCRVFTGTVPLDATERAVAEHAYEARWMDTAEVVASMHAESERWAPWARIAWVGILGARFREGAERVRERDGCRSVPGRSPG